MNKHFLIVFIVFLFGQYIISQSTYDSSLNEFLTNKNIQNANVGIELISGSSGAVLMQHQSNKTLLPASIHKLYTTSYALNQLGWNYSFKTTVLTNGKMDIQNQTLNGDLILSLVGDPSLESRYFDSLSFLVDLKRLIQKLKIKKIKGSLKIKPNIDNYQVNSEWLWGDLGNYYGAGYSTHTFRDNYVDVYFNSSDFLGEITSINKLIPTVDSFKVKNRVVGSSTKRDLSYAFGAPYQNERLMIGEIPSNRKDFKVKIAMHDPKSFLSSSILDSLKSLNISFLNLLVEDSELIDTLMVYESPILNDLISCVNFKSNNNYAEHLLMKSVLLKDSLVTIDKAASVMQEYWEEKLSIFEGIRFSDGCGLSRKNLTSAHAINQLLLYNLNNLSEPSESKNAESFIASLPIAGKSGTLKYIGNKTAISGNFKGKSGSMEGVRCYSGYFLKNNQHYPFTIMVNNFLCKDVEIRKLIEKLMVDIYAQI